jgi:hypothetical protein
MKKIMVLFLLMISVGFAATPVGYEFLDSGKVLHIWNEKDSYYFNTSSKMQFTNHYQEYWTRNIFYGNGNVWINYFGQIKIGQSKVIMQLM